jgi:hypothetical protein
MEVKVDSLVEEWLDDVESLTSRELAERLQDIERAIRAGHAARAAIVAVARRDSVTNWVQGVGAVSRHEA